MVNFNNPNNVDQAQTTPNNTVAPDILNFGNPLEDLFDTDEEVGYGDFLAQISQLMQPSTPDTTDNSVTNNDDAALPIADIFNIADVFNTAAQEDGDAALAKLMTEIQNITQVQTLGENDGNLEKILDKVSQIRGIMNPDNPAQALTTATDDGNALLAQLTALIGGNAAEGNAAEGNTATDNAMLEQLNALSAAITEASGNTTTGNNDTLLDQIAALTGGNTTTNNNNALLEQLTALVGGNAAAGNNTLLGQIAALTGDNAAAAGDNNTQQPPINVQTGVDIAADETKSDLEKITELTGLIAQLGGDSALDQTLSAYIDSLIEVQSQQNILEMNNQSTQANAILDEQMLALRNNYLVFSKQLEQYTLDAQNKEKVTNLLFDLTFNITTNRFQLAKTVVNAAKY
ncbi:MAG: hypothetical protein ACJARD_000260 [Alphaproteobacteria bacterium]|jgi:hypothetical protein